MCIKEFSELLTITTLQKIDLIQYSDLIFQMNAFKIDNKELTLKNQTLDSIYVLKYKNKIISTSKLIIEEKLYDPVAHIEDVVTHNDYRRNGYGMLMIQYLCNIAFNTYKCYKVVLHSNDDNESFYRKCNMKKYGCSLSIYK